MKKRELWLDYIRAIACFMVAFIHFVESMEQSGIIDFGGFYQWMERTMYYIPVPIFFFCSGYLYQMGKPVDSMQAYWKSIKSKLINLGIPYLFFVLLTIGMKYILGSSVNTPVDKSLWEYLLVSPPGQMWYLLVLIMCFLLIPTMNERNSQAILFISAVLKMVALTGIEARFPIVEMKFMDYGIWFVLGMLVSYKGWKPDNKWFLVGMCWFPVMVLVMLTDKAELLLQSVISLFGILLLAGVCVKCKRECRVLDLLSKYMLQIYLLHTMCAACVRIVLLKLSITSGVVHCVLGLLSSFAGPVIIAIILEKSVVGNVIFFPTKTWKQLREGKRIEKDV